MTGDQPLKIREQSVPDARELSVGASEFSLETLYAETGFLTQEIQEAARAIVGALQTAEVDPNRLREAWTQYDAIVEALIEASDDALRARLQIAATVYKGDILRAGPEPQRYLEQLDIAELHARNIGDDELAGVLDTEIEQNLKDTTFEMNPTILVVLMRGKVSENDRQFMRDLIAEGDDMEDLIGYACGALIEGGEDPEAIMGSLGMLE